MIQTKKEIRQQIRRAKETLTLSDKLMAEESVLNRLKNNKHITSAKNIVAYWAMEDELPTQKIIETLWNNGQNIFLPIIVGDEIEFRQYEGINSLKAEPKYGILEPTSPTTLSEEADAVVLVPGIAFSKNGARLGRGGGYYDKILARLRDAYKIGIAFRCQEREDIPTETFDIDMDEVIFG